jgi:predicted transcriptional regulator
MMIKSATYDKDKIIELYKKGYSFLQIANKLELSRGIVSGFISRSLKVGRIQRVVKTIAASIPPTKVEKVNKKVAVNKFSKQFTFKNRPFGYVEPTKSELRAALTKALENTK